MSEEPKHTPKLFGEELNIFDVPCPKCGKSIFALPYKPKLTHKIHCPNCDSSNYIHIDSKGGIFMLTEEEFESKKCRKCNGKGICPRCNGTSKVICPQCKGKGYYTEQGLYGRVNYLGCHDCGGSGSTDYKIDIPKRLVMGSGRASCPECNGNGICPDCGGEGLIL